MSIVRFRRKFPSAAMPVERPRSRGVRGRFYKESKVCRVRLIAPATSVHTRLWAEEFSRRGHSVEVVTVAQSTPLGLVRKFIGGLLERILCQVPEVTVVHSLGTHALASLMLPRGRRNVIVPWGSEVVAAHRSALRGFIARMALARADLVLVTSHSMAASIQKGWPATKGITQVVSWGVSAPFLGESGRASSARSATVRGQLGISQDEILVVAPRGIGVVYRSGELRAAFAEARSRRKDLRLVVLGAEESAFPREGEILLPYLTKAELADLFAAADLMVSIPAADQRSTTVLEATASGVGLILSDIPPYRELVDLGVGATLLREPVGPELMAALAVAGKIDPELAERNRNLMRVHENQETQMTRVVDLCTTEASCA